MNLQDALSRLSKPPEPGIKWDCRDREACRLVVGTVSMLAARVENLERLLKLLDDALYEEVMTCYKELHAEVKEVLNQ